jgi:hypothetical protein
MATPQSSMGAIDEASGESPIVVTPATPLPPSLTATDGPVIQMEHSRERIESEFSEGSKPRYVLTMGFPVFSMVFLGFLTIFRRFLSFSNAFCRFPPLSNRFLSFLTVFHRFPSFSIVFHRFLTFSNHFLTFSNHFLTIF